MAGTDTGERRGGRVRRVFSAILYRVPGVEPFLAWTLKKIEFAVLAFYKPKEDVKLIKRVDRETSMLMQPSEAFTILSFARCQSDLEGDLAEVGVYRGGSAALICEAKGSRDFWAFDTFEGLSDVGNVDRHWGVRFFKHGQYRSDLKSVSAYLGKYEGVNLIKGYFPDSAGQATNRQFSFVHLDVDTYASTIAALRFFWPRLVPNGVMITHDSHAEGVAKAVDEFVGETRARTLPTTGSQLAFLR